MLRRIRYVFNLSDSQTAALFSLANLKVSRAQVSSWLAKEDDPAFELCSDKVLATFLNGLIIDKRGKKEGVDPVPEEQLTNNIVFRKLNIALSLQADDILRILDLSDIIISRHELSAFFRKPGHKHYRECQDQILKGFLKGLQLKYRPGKG